MQKKKSVLAVIFLASLILLTLAFLLFNSADMRAVIKAAPLLNAAAHEAWIRPTHRSSPYQDTDDKGRDVFVFSLSPNTDLFLSYDDADRAFRKQIHGMNSYLKEHPDFYSSAKDKIIELHIQCGARYFVITNIDCLDAASETVSPTADYAITDLTMMRVYGCDYFREMRGVYYDAETYEHGDFLEAVGDPSVLENLERIGPKSNFSDEELAWFVENLPDCEVVDLEAEQTS